MEKPEKPEAPKTVAMVYVCGGENTRLFLIHVKRLLAKGQQKYFKNPPSCSQTV